jgi:methylated-DNA-[protein]-cysteine S-methyltransferase
MSYGEIAKVIAKKRGIAKMSAQAVGNAVGSNPLPIIIPCHRVIGSDGSMVGYGGGLDKKIKLLHLEGIL